MAGATILDLPNELIDRIYFYLDWNRSSSLRPIRPDIISISLTCRRLREPAIPILFRDVTLKLRWVGGCLIEPSLFRVRREYSHLAKHVRCVFVHTIFGHFRDQKSKLKSFAVPTNLKDWLYPADTFDTEGGDKGSDASHRWHVKNVVKRFFEDTQVHESGQKCSLALRGRAENLANQFLEHSELPAPGRLSWLQQEEHDFNGGLLEQGRLGEDTFFDVAREEHAAARGMQGQRDRQRDLRLQLDALVLVLLCLPATVNSIVFESQPTDRMDLLQNAFSLNVIAKAISVFGDRLQNLTFITTGPFGFSSYHGDSEKHTERKIINADIVGRLETIQSLTLAHQASPLSNDDLSIEIQRWQALPSSLTRFELWSSDYAAADLRKLIESFTNLDTLALHDMGLTAGAQRNVVQRTRTHATITDWLALLIDIRRAMPQLEIQLHDIHGTYEVERRLPASATLWLMREAVPVGDPVTFERETRLMEDFSSFLPMWYAEDSIRGDQARHERQDGKLVDQAMNSRWR